MVGGQAVNLWAITFLEKGDKSLAVKTYGSEDMDLLDEDKVLKFLESAPGWKYIKRGVQDPFDIRVGRATSMSDDNRVLLVEVVKGVKGLEKEEIVASTVEYHGTVYRLLDPIALLKAKAANVRELDQIGPPPRHDREHLNLIVDCLPHFISAVLKNPKAEEKAPKTVSRLFSTLQHRKTADTLRKEGVHVLSLITSEIKSSIQIPHSSYSNHDPESHIRQQTHLAKSQGGSLVANRLPFAARKRIRALQLERIEPVAM